MAGNPGTKVALYKQADYPLSEANENRRARWPAYPFTYQAISMGGTQRYGEADWVSTCNAGIHSSGSDHPQCVLAYPYLSANGMEQKRTTTGGRLAALKNSKVAELLNIANGIRQEYAAIRVALMEEWSNM